MANWPQKFTILRTSFSEPLADRVISSSMDVGPAKKRRRTILGVEEVRFTVRIPVDMFDEFKEFYYTNDVGVFDFIHPRTGKTVLARFKGVPTGTSNETLYDISVTLEILP